MLFNSFAFLIFLPAVFFLYWFVFSKSLRWQNLLVLFASYFFYGWWSWKFMLLLAVSTLLDFLYGFGVASVNSKKSKLYLWLSVINNLGILAIFKYYNFFAREFQKGFELFGLHTHPIFLNIALPIGISFYTFHGMSYIFDIYNGKQKPVSNFIEYAVFVSFFPLLVAGPIERAHHLLPQIQKPRFFNYPQAVQGCRLVLWGLFKKVVIADSLAVIADNAFSNYASLNGLSLIIGATAFSFQIYSDFSGYSDIAIGSAKLFGIELLSNFKFPYFSRDIAEFWRRWHVSLSSWFRDYLYIPLGGSKEGNLKAVRNTFIIFLVSGFWHGASWNFIIWGGIHAMLFLPLLLTGNNRRYRNDVVAQEKLLPSIKDLSQIGLTFFFVTLAWVFFRADDLGHAVGYLSKIVTSLQQPSQFISKPEGKRLLVFVLLLVPMDWRFRRDERNLSGWHNNKTVRWIMYILLGNYIIYTILSSKIESFIYFQF